LQVKKRSHEGLGNPLGGKKNERQCSSQRGFRVAHMRGKMQKGNHPLFLEETWPHRRRGASVFRKKNGLVFKRWTIGGPGKEADTSKTGVLSLPINGHTSFLFTANDTKKEYFVDAKGWGPGLQGGGMLHWKRSAVKRAILPQGANSPCG